MLPAEAAGVAAEPTATVMWEVLAELDFLPLLWSACPWHTHVPGRPLSNRTPTPAEAALGTPFWQALTELFPIETVVAVGNVAHRSLQRSGLDVPKIRHPAHGGQGRFQAGLQELLASRRRSCRSCRSPGDAAGPGCRGLRRRTGRCSPPGRPVPGGPAGKAGHRRRRRRLRSLGAQRCVEQQRMAAPEGPARIGGTRRPSPGPAGARSSRATVSGSARAGPPGPPARGPRGARGQFPPGMNCPFRSPSPGSRPRCAGPESVPARDIRGAGAEHHHHLAAAAVEQHVGQHLHEGAAPERKQGFGPRPRRVPAPAGSSTPEVDGKERNHAYYLRGNDYPVVGVLPVNGG